MELETPHVVTYILNLGTRGTCTSRWIFFYWESGAIICRFMVSTMRLVLMALVRKV